MDISGWIVGACVACVVMAGQPEGPAKPSSPGAGSEPPATIKLEDLPPAVRLGLRAEAVRRQIPVSPVIVLVPDEVSYVQAIARWRPALQFPVLIDDGSWEGVEDIARFARAFGPAEVVRWKSDEAWPVDPGERRGAIDRAAARAWGSEDAAGYAGALKALGLTPPGIVAVSISDPAWTAGLALAAGRGQVLAWVTPGGGLDSQMAMEVADELSAQIVGAAKATGLKWEGLGDDLDAVTLCMGAPVRTVWPKGAGAVAPAGRGLMTPVPGEPVATTDVIGRHVEAAGGDRMRRWAWCGQIAGSGRAAAYRAMCGLFLMPRNAWLFDGYEGKEPWSQFSAAEAAEVLKGAGIESVVDKSPRQGLVDWRDRAAGAWLTRGGGGGGGGGEGADGKKDGRGGVEAGLICVNTSGNADDFNLKPGQGLSEDVPVLSVPAMVHFVHSWSAQFPGLRTTVAARWIERGAYAYVGSVHEPYLQAFQPTPVFVKRMLAVAPLGAAARLDGAPPWRITVLGDPLITLGPARQRGAKVGADVLPGAVNLRDGLREDLRGRRFEAALAGLLIAGRDADAVRLVKAVAAEKAEDLTEGAALVALGPAFREADFEALTLCAGRLGAGGAGGGAHEKHPVARDLLWHALIPASPRLTAEHARLLGSLLRPASYARDASEAARLIRRLEGEPARRAYLEDVLARTTDPNKKKQIDTLLTGR